MFPQDILEVLDAGRAFNGGNPPEVITAGDKAVPNFRKDEASMTLLGVHVFPPSAVLKTRTPLLARLVKRMPSTGTRMSWPPLVTSITSSSPATGKEATSAPLRWFTAMATMPLPPGRSFASAVSAGHACQSKKPATPAKRARIRIPAPLHPADLSLDPVRAGPAVGFQHLLVLNSHLCGC